MGNHQKPKATKVVKQWIVAGVLIGLGVVIGLYSGHKENALFQIAKSTYSLIRAVGQPDMTQGCNFSLQRLEISVNGKTDYYCFLDNPGQENLIVNLHHWSANAGNGGDPFVFEYARNKNTDYVLPNLGGSNRNSNACGSEWSIKNLDQIISKLVLMNGVAYKKVVVLGVSGGGFTALNHMLRGEQPVDHYISVVPITSLETWFYQSKNTHRKFADDILECTHNLEFADKRSPITYVKNIVKFKGSFFMYHGISDGYSGSVSAIHSIRFWNAVNPASQIPKNQIIQILSLDTPYVKEPLKPLFTFTSRFGEFVLFNGGHEAPSELIVKKLDHLLRE